MKGRIWVVVILIIALVMVVLSVGLFDRLKINERTREYLSQLISRSVDADVNVRSVSLLPWSLRINDVTVTLRDRPLTLTAERVSIGFSILKFIIEGPLSLYGARDIYVYRPEAVWDLERTFDSATLPMEQTTRALDTAIGDVPAIRVNVADGAFVFRRGDSTFVVADHVGGWLDGSRSDGVVDLRVKGNVLSAEENMSLEGKIYPRGQGFDATFVCTGGDLSRPGIPILTGDIIPRAGTMDLQLSVSREDTVTVVQGAYRIGGGMFDIAGLNISVSDMAIAGHLTRREMYLDSLTGKVWGVTPTLSGQLTLVPEPVIHLEIAAEDIDVERVLSDIFPKLETSPEGTMSFRASVDGPIRGVTSRAAVSFERLGYDGHELTAGEFGVTFDGREISVDRFAADYGNFRISGGGTVGAATDNGSYPFRLNLAAAEGREEDLSLDLAGRANGGQRSLAASLTARWSKLPYPVTGTVAVDDEMTELDLAIPGASCAISVEGFGNSPRISGTIVMDEFPVLSYAGLEDSGLHLTGETTVEGPVDSLSVEGGVRVIWGQNLDTMMMTSALVYDLLGKDRGVDLVAQLLNTRVRYSHPAAWDLRLRADHQEMSAWLDDLQGSTLAVSLDPADGGLTGALDLNGFPLAWIVDVFVREEFSHRGDITGVAAIGGTMGHPGIVTPEPMHVTDLRIGGLDRLEGTVTITGSPDSLHFADARITRKGMPFMDADGLWVRGNPFVLEASGRDVDLAAIDDVISDTRRTDGNADYAFTMSFMRRSGTIEGGFSIGAGHFFDIPFDRASGTLGGGSDGFRVTGFSIDKTGVYHGEGTASSGYLWRDATEAPGLRLLLNLDGDLIRALPHLTGALRDATGNCRAALTFGGSWQDPVLLDGELAVEQGVIEPAFLIDRVEDVSTLIRIDPDTATMTGFRAARIVEGSGSIGAQRLEVRNVHPGDPEWGTVVPQGMVTVPNEAANLDFGVMLGRVVAGTGRNDAVSLHVPGFLKAGETGMFRVAGQSGEWFAVGASGDGDLLTPYIAGTVTVLSGDVYYPLLSETPDVSGVSDAVADEEAPGFLHDIFWNLTINAGANVNYVSEHNLQIGRFAGTNLWRNEIGLEENSRFTVTGRLSDESFRVTGNARSTSGFVSYYGYTFDIDWVELELDTDNVLKPAILTGRAITSAYDDSTGVENEVYLHIDFVDRVSGRVTEARGGFRATEGQYDNPYRPQTQFDAGALGIIEIRFTSNNPSDDTQEKILARLGISPGGIGAAATRAITSGMDYYYFNPLLRPFEERIKRVFRLDMVRITPSILGNFAESQLGLDRNYYPNTNSVVFDRSRITVGEYFLKDWFISYTGQYGVGRDYLSRREQGFFHDIGLQYLLDRNIRLQLQYNYDEIMNQDDKRIQIRYDFGFE